MFERKKKRSVWIKGGKKNNKKKKWKDKGEKNVRKIWKNGKREINMKSTNVKRVKWRKENKY